MRKRVQKAGLWFIAALFAAALIQYGDQILFLRKSLGPDFSREEDQSSLILTNKALEGEIEKLLFIKEATLHFNPQFLSAPVFSSYPFNSKKEITIAAGEVNGLKPKMAVLADGFFLGIVVRVYKNYSTVKTVFDLSFEMPVKIGQDGIAGLMKGGALPKVELIPRESSVKNGDGVYSASAEVPFGLLMGDLGELAAERGDVWIDAPLKIPYDVKGLKAVSVILNYE